MTLYDEITVIDSALTLNTTVGKPPRDRYGLLQANEQVIAIATLARPMPSISAAPMPSTAATDWTTQLEEVNK
jgi:hypothetical protein